MGIKHATTGTGTKVTNTIWAADHTIDGDVLPDTDVTHDLGSLAYRFAEIHSTALKSVGSIYASGTYIQFLHTVGGARANILGMDTTSFNFSPSVDNTGYLGVATKAWKGINAYNAVSEDQNIGLSFHMLDEPLNTLFLDDINATSGAWTDEDVTADTSANAKFVKILVSLIPSVIGAATTFCDIGFRKNGITPATVQKLRVPMESVGVANGLFAEFTVPLDSGQVMEYFFTCGVGWTSDVNVYVVGWWE